MVSHTIPLRIELEDLTLRMHESKHQPIAWVSSGAEFDNSWRASFHESQDLLLVMMTPLQPSAFGPSWMISRKCGMFVWRVLRTGIDIGWYPAVENAV
jgi:hypothetical protein